MKEFQEKVWLKDRVMQDFQSNAEEAIERANELDKNLEEKEEDTNTKNETIADLTRLVEEMKAELARNDVKEIKQELAMKDASIDHLKAKLSGAKKDVEHKEQELEHLKKASDDFQTVSSNLEEKEYEVTQLEALQSDLRTQISFKDDQLLALQKTVEEQKVKMLKNNTIYIPRVFKPKWLYTGYRIVFISILMMYIEYLPIHNNM